MKTAIVTGSLGFIGSALCRRLRGDGWRVVGIDRKAGATELPETDLCRVSAKGLPLPHVDAVFHLAAFPGVSFSAENPALAYSNNVAATVSVLAIAKEAGASRFVFASSSSVYGNGASEGKRPSVESDPLAPLNAYAASKVECERIVRDFSRYAGIESVILRPFSVYGPGMRPDLAMSKIADSIQKGGIFMMRGDGSSLRDYTYIDDVVEAFLFSASAPLKGGAQSVTLNVGAGSPVALVEVVSQLERALGAKARIEAGDEAPYDAAQTWANAEFAKRYLGWVPKVGFTEGIRKFAEWRRGMEICS